MAIDARPEERREIGPVAAGERLEPGAELQLGLRFRQVEPAGPEGLRNVGEERVDGVDAERLEHPLAVTGGVRAVGHRA